MGMEGRRDGVTRKEGWIHLILEQRGLPPEVRYLHLQQQPALEGLRPQGRQQNRGKERRKVVGYNKEGVKGVKGVK